MSKKTIFPYFGAAGWNAIYTPNNNKATTSTQKSFDLKTWDFYHATASLLFRFFINDYAAGVDEKNFGLQMHLEPTNKFSLYFHPTPESDIEPDVYNEIMQNFAAELVKAFSEDDMPDIQIICGGPDDFPVYIIRSSNIKQMLMFTENILAPYDIELNLTPETARGLSLIKSFQMDGLYDLGRVKSLAYFALGIPSIQPDYGRHLTH